MQITPIPYRWVREASDISGRSVAILVDLQGPKIRLGRFASGPVELVVGEEFIVTTEDCPGDANMVSTTFAGLPGDVNPGDRVLVDDGRIELQVIKVVGPRVHTVVIDGGIVSNNKGFNLPGVSVSVPALSEKDPRRFALGDYANGADLVGTVVFVRSSADIHDVHSIMDEEGIRIPVLAKVEKPQAVDNLEDIIAAFDGVMVARGDLGVELPLEMVPLVQKRAIQMCREAGKPVIVATQMLGLDDLRKPTDQSRGERRSKCCPRRSRRADALGRDQRWRKASSMPLRPCRQCIEHLGKKRHWDRIPPLQDSPTGSTGAGGHTCGSGRCGGDGFHIPHCFH